MRALLLIASFPLLAQTIVLQHANVIDGISAEPIRNVNVVIRDGKIVSIGSAAAESGATVFDLQGKWLLPGLLDAHVHIADMRSARSALQSGVTTARSMGVSNFVDVEMRERHRAGDMNLPEMVASGYHVRPDPAEDIFLNVPSLMDLRRPVSGTQNILRLVRANLDRNVNVIKILSTERAGTPNTDPRKRVFLDNEIAAIVDEAAGKRIPVAAHAHGAEGAHAAVVAGVRSIEHGTYLREDTLALMKQKGVFFDPTIATVVDLVEPGGDYDDPALMIRGRHMLPRIRETAANAVKMGVLIIAGTDTSYGPKSTRRIPDELLELVRAGMSPMAAIQSATSVSAKCLGVDNRTGSIRPGFEADLIVVERNPLNDLSGLLDVLMVINNGRPVINRLDPSK